MIRAFLFLWAIFFSYTPYALADLVQTVRGEFHNGEVLQKSFSLRTEYGELIFPKSEIRRLNFHHDDHEVVTVNGEVMRGEILETSIVTTRQLGPQLELSLSEISFIDLSDVHQMSSETDVSVVEMINGDVLLVKPLLKELSLQMDTAKKTFNFIGLRLIDFSYSEDLETQVARLTTSEGDIHKGALSEGSFKVETLQGNRLSLPYEAIAFVLFSVNSQQHLKGERLFPQTYPSEQSNRIIQDRFVDERGGPEMVVLPAGEFMRGQGDGDFDEQPVQKVVLKNSFAISRYEITFEDYGQYCRETKCDRPEDSGWGTGRRPVINVSWEEASAYVKWLSEKTGERYRLPTDAEWEYAARAGSQGKFYWGEHTGEERANCAGCVTIWGSERTARVGRFAPNAFGLFDMAGNVFEWTQDCWNNTYENIGLDGHSYENPAGCGKRVIRGGGWSFPPKEVRSANRWRDFPTRRSDDTGFRVVRELK